MSQSAEITRRENHSATATITSAAQCEFELQVFSKYDDATVVASGPTLSIAVSHSLPELRHLAHSRAVFGARRMPAEGRTYGSWELIFPEDEERPTAGYDRFAIRHSFDFEDEIEVFDVSEEYDTAEGLLRYRAQDLGDDEKARAIIADGVREYLAAAYQQMLWDPKSKLDIAQELDDLFLERDWTSFVSREDLKTPEVRVSDVELLDWTDADECLVRFHYVNGEKSGYEVEFVDIKKGRLTIRKNAYSALRSAVPAFRGDQLPSVYNALQKSIDAFVNPVL
ncbi:hypothetical protein [Rhizobium laguerreae]|uniref:hypothetical protein n=1 Tax=Rhizobium laguerreae TaxID=1076926 RepID=UPI0014410698|nr:hypothetical protein [Rhizobium laguerreae]